jgi:hypothetical protein
MPRGISSARESVLMPATRALVILGAAILLSLGLGLGASVAADSDPPPEVAPTVWADAPADLDDLADDSTAVVEATVTSVDTGPNLVDSEHPDDPEGMLPTQRITFQTDSVLDGQIDDTFTLFKTGSDNLELSNDPAYVEGQRYVLFVRPRQGDPDTYLPVAPDGRYHLDANNEADPVVDSPTTDQLDGDTPAQIQNEVQG